MLTVVEEFKASDPGRQRPANEDNLFARMPVFVVADGMGGAQAGEVASRIAVEAFEPGLPDGGSPEEQLAARAREANSRIHEMAATDPDHAGMGTTLTAAHVGEAEVSLAHVGDSRAYLFRDGELTQLTHDHSLVAEMTRRGQITEEEAAEHPQKSIITRALGPEASVEVDTRTQPSRADDVFLLCSDGLTSMIGDGEVAQVMRSSQTLEEAGRGLIDSANRAGGRDNITVILFRVGDVGGDVGDEPAHDSPTIVGEAALKTADVEAALARREAEAAPAAPPPRRTAPLPPIAPPPGVAGPKPKHARRVIGVLAAVALLAVIAIGAWIASRQVFFVGTNAQGVVTVYRGLPYELPFGINLYESFYDSGVSATQVPPARRKKLLDHQLRSQGDASKLVRLLERGQLRS